MAWEIGTVTAAAALRDELEETLAVITGLSVRAIRRKLHAARGNTHVRNVLHDEWPWAPEQLGRLRVALARDQGLVDEIVYVTELTARTVRRRLGREHGAMLVENAFRDHWPEPEEDEEGYDEEPAEEEDEGYEEDDESEGPATSADSFNGEHIAGRYIVGKRLGKGGFGEVFEAWDELSERRMVLKFANDDDMEALKREFGRVFDLSHPHICRVSLQQDQLTGQAFLVMPHAGRSIEDFIRRHGALPVEDAVDVVTAVAAALDFAHEHKVIHHDVSPGNILVDEKDTVRLTDFGVAVVATQRMTTRGGATLLAATAIGLHRGYAAPEMYVGQARRASDQFSLAQVFGAMVDGALYSTPPSYRSRRALSAAQNRALKKATQIDPRKRFDSCSEFAAALAEGL